MWVGVRTDVRHVTAVTLCLSLHDDFGSGVHPTCRKICMYKPRLAFLVKWSVKQSL